MNLVRLALLVAVATLSACEDSQDPQAWNNDPQAWNNDPQAWNNDPQAWNNDPQAWNNDPQAWNNDQAREDRDAQGRFSWGRDSAQAWDQETTKEPETETNDPQPWTSDEVNRETAYNLERTSSDSTMSTGGQEEDLLKALDTELAQDEINEKNEEETALENDVENAPIFGGRRPRRHLVRLANGTSRNEGRVEIFHAGRWGTVCDDDWSIKDGTVVCRQLGYPAAFAATRKARFGEGRGQIWMKSVRCKGNEKDLARCRFNGWGRHNCNHREDAGVICRTRGNNVRVRLVGGKTRNAGRVEVFYRGRWGTVCDDEFGMQDAHVICKQMGYRKALAVVPNAKFGQGSGNIWMDNVRCSGRERNIGRCVFNGWGNHNCNHREDVGVVCQSRVPIRVYRLCEHRAGVLRCPRGRKISVVYGNYGRTTGRAVCPHRAMRTTNCRSRFSSQMIRCACHGRNMCRLFAKNEVYGDPCVGTFKYIEVRYMCV